MPRNIVVLAAILGLAVVAGVLHFTHVEPVVIFIVAGTALGGLAWAISIATESVGERFGPAVTGALQSTLGNLPELFIVLVGARAAPGGVMRFRTRLPQDTATLLLLAISIIVLLGLSNQVGDRASRHQMTISAIGAVTLLVVYGIWLAGYLRSDGPREEAHSGEARGALSFNIALTVLAVSGVAAAFVSDWFINALDPAVKSLPGTRSRTWSASHSQRRASQTSRCRSSRTRSRRSQSSSSPRSSFARSRSTRT